jgi:hypothetical protein
MRNGSTTGRFTVKGATSVEVIGEGRTLKVVEDRFEDRFAPYQVHIYRLTE